LAKLADLIRYSFHIINIMFRPNGETMVTKSPLRPFIPRPEQSELIPEITGNSINGLNELQFRRPRYVYWGNNPDEIAHGPLQKWFYTVNPQNPDFALERAKRQKALDLPLVNISDMPLNWSKEGWEEQTDTFKALKIFDKLGATPFDQKWAYEGIDISFKNIIVMGFQHDYQNIEFAPKPEAGAEVMRQYSRAAAGAKFMANFIRNAGWDAEPLMGPMSGKITMIPAALAAGFGELGKHGSIINPEFGSSFRLSAVLTDAPVYHNSREEHNIDEFCSTCRICEDACPPEAIFKEKKTVRGVNKWYVDFDKCLPFFNEHQGCSICIAVCPWSRPGLGLNLAKKLKRRSQRKTDT